MLHNQIIKKLGKIYDQGEISDMDAMKKYISFHNETKIYCNDELENEQSGRTLSNILFTMPSKFSHVPKKIKGHNTYLFESSRYLFWRGTVIF